MYPVKLMRYLKEQADEGAIITQTNSGDAYFWAIEIPLLKNYIVMIAWYEGCDDYQLINLEGAAFRIIGKMTAA